MNTKVNLWFFSTLITISVLLSGTTIENYSFEQKLSEGIEKSDGSSILLEEYTATWCKICTEIDEDVEELSELHKDRVVLIRVHPADGIDDLGNYASATRIGMLFNGSTKGTPTFIIDGDVTLEGQAPMSQLNSEILQTQSNKINFSKINLSVIRVNETLEFEIEIENSNGILNLMIIENDVTANNPEGDLDKFNNVLREMISINLSEENIISGGEEWEFEINKNEGEITILLKYSIDGDLNLKNLGFVSSHEMIENGEVSVKGTIQIIDEENRMEINSNYLIIFSVFLIIGIFASFGKFGRKINSIQESE